MKLKKAKIIVESFEETNKRWLKALKAKMKTKKNEEIITVPDWNVLGKVFSPPRLEILRAIPVYKPHSIAELARLIKKDFKNVYSDIQFLAGLGLIELKEKPSAKKQLIPIAKYQGIELLLAA